MLKIIFLIISMLSLQVQAAAAAKPAEKDVKTKQPEVQNADTKALSEQLEQDLPSLPRGLRSIVAGYGAKTTTAQDVIHMAEIAFKELGEIYELVRINMPTREQLSLLSYGSGKEFDAGVVALRESILGSLLAKVAIPKRVEEWQRIDEMMVDTVRAFLVQHRDAHDSFLAFSRPSVHFPFRAGVRQPWEQAGFVFRPQMIFRTRMQCPGCAAEVFTLQPWMQPQYYHNPGCKTFAAVLADPVLADRYRVVAYGQEIPEDPEEYWQYTMGFLDRYTRAQADASDAPNKATAQAFKNRLKDYSTLPGWATMARYAENYAPDLDEATRKAQYQSLNQKPLFFQEFWDLGAKKPKK